MAARKTNINDAQKVAQAAEDKFVNYRIDEQNDKLDKIDSKVDKGFEQINARIDKFTFAPLATVEKLDVKVEAIKKTLEDDYVKKTDNATFRNIGIAILTAVSITIATLIVTGGLKNAQ